MLYMLSNTKNGENKDEASLKAKERFVQEVSRFFNALLRSIDVTLVQQAKPELLDLLHDAICIFVDYLLVMKETQVMLIAMLVVIIQASADSSYLAGFKAGKESNGHQLTAAHASRGVTE